MRDAAAVRERQEIRFWSSGRAVLGVADLQRATHAVLVPRSTDFGGRVCRAPAEEAFGRRCLELCLRPTRSLAWRRITVRDGSTSRWEFRI
jgi:hypothetical protein